MDLEEFLKQFKESQSPDSSEDTTGDLSNALKQSAYDSASKLQDLKNQLQDQKGIERSTLGFEMPEGAKDIRVDRAKQSLLDQYKDISPGLQQNISNYIQQRDQNLDNLSQKIPNPESNLSFEELRNRFQNPQEFTPSPTGMGVGIMTKSTIPTSPQTTKSTSPQEDEMIKAIGARNQNQLLANLLSAGSTIGNAIARTNVNAGQEASKSLLAQSENPISDLLTSQKYAANKVAMMKEKEMSDATSSRSKGARELVTKLTGITVPQDMTAADVEKTFPTIASIMNTKEKSKENAMYKEALEQGRNDRKYTSQMQLLNKQFLQGNPSSKQAFEALPRVANLYATIGVDPSKKIDQLTPDDIKQINNSANRVNVVEAGIELNRILSGRGVPAQNTLNKLIPQNIQMDKAKALDYFTSKLNPTQQGEFLKNSLKIAERVRDQSLGNLKSYAKQVYGGAYNTFLNKSPERLEDAKNTIASALGDPAAAEEIFSSVGGADTKSEQKSAEPSSMQPMNKAAEKLQNELSSLGKSQTTPSSPMNEERRLTKDGRTAIFDKNTKQFLRYE